MGRRRNRFTQDGRCLDASAGSRRYQPSHLHAGHDGGRLDTHRPKDLIDRRFDQGELDRVWTSDITYLRTGEGWLYFCAVRDGRSRRVIGWAIAEHMHTDLVEAALAMAVAMRGQRPERVIFHADHGSQYTSGQLARFARAHDLAQSVGRTDVCWDNAQAESFWAALKVEFNHQFLWPTKRHAKVAAGDWTERVYNRRRRHSPIGMISPVEFEEQFAQATEAAWPSVHWTGSTPVAVPGVNGSGERRPQNGEWGAECPSQHASSQAPSYSGNEGFGSSLTHPGEPATRVDERGRAREVRPSPTRTPASTGPAHTGSNSATAHSDP